jgi:hypothetical protein
MEEDLLQLYLRVGWSPEDSNLWKTNKRRYMIHEERESVEASHQLLYHQEEEVLQVMWPIYSGCIDSQKVEQISKFDQHFPTELSNELLFPLNKPPMIEGILLRQLLTQPFLDHQCQIPTLAPVD